MRGGRLRGEREPYLVTGDGLDSRLSREGVGDARRLGRPDPYRPALADRAARPHHRHRHAPAADLLGPRRVRPLGAAAHGLLVDRPSVVQLVARRLDRERARLADAQPHGPASRADRRERRAAERHRRELRQRGRGGVASVHGDPPVPQDGRRAGQERHRGEHVQRVEAGSPRRQGRASAGQLRERPTVRVGARRRVAGKGGDGDRRHETLAEASGYRGGASLATPARPLCVLA